MVAAILALVGVVAGVYLPWFVGHIASRPMRLLVGLLVALVAFAVLSVAGILAAANGLVSRASGGAGSVSFALTLLVVVTASALRGRARRQPAPQPDLEAADDLDERGPALSDEPLSGINWDEGLGRLWMLLSGGWVIVCLAVLFVQLATLDPSFDLSLKIWPLLGIVAVGLALPPLVLGVVGFGVRWVLMGFRTPDVRRERRRQGGQ